MMKAANRLQWQDEELSLWVSQLYPWILRVGMASGCCTQGLQAQWVWDLGMGPIPVHQHSARPSPYPNPDAAWASPSYLSSLSIIYSTLHLFRI